MRAETPRREFLAQVGGAAGVAALAPLATSCVRQAGETTPGAGSAGPAADAAPTGPAAAPDPLAVPLVRPEGWDAIAFNRDRGNAGAIPESYLADINGPSGPNDHLGKHLPFVPGSIASAVPPGFLAVMWGDPSVGHARHPNAPEGTPSYERGHFYDWVRVRKAVPGEAEELESTYTSWPTSAEGDTGRYAAEEGDDPAADGGRNTVYLVALPADVAPGDLVRIYGHCRYHGEYVDFLTLPA